MTVSSMTGAAGPGAGPAENCAASGTFGVTGPLSSAGCVQDVLSPRCRSQGAYSLDVALIQDIHVVTVSSKTEGARPGTGVGEQYAAISLHLV